MTVLLAIETKQADGTMYRVAFGCSLLPLVSWLIGIGRLF